MKPALRVVPVAQVQLSLAVGGVLRDVRHAFYGLCVNAGKQVLAAMMEADRVWPCAARQRCDCARLLGAPWGRTGRRAGLFRSAWQQATEQNPARSARLRSRRHANDRVQGDGGA